MSQSKIVELQSDIGAFVRKLELNDDKIYVINFNKRSYVFFGYADCMPKLPIYREQPSLTLLD